MSSQLHDLLKWQEPMANSTTQHTSNQVFLHNCSDLIHISTKNAQSLNMHVLASVCTTCLQTPSVAAASASGSCHRLAGSGSRRLHHAGSNNKLTCILSWHCELTNCTAVFLFMVHWKTSFKNPTWNENAIIFHGSLYMQWRSGWLVQTIVRFKKTW